MISKNGNQVIVRLQSLNYLKDVRIILKNSTGASGAEVLDITCDAASYVLKLVDKAKITHGGLLNSFLKEFEFYALPKSNVLKGKLLKLIPEVIYQENTEETLFILMKKYRAIPPHGWSPDLLCSAVDLITDIHALPIREAEVLGLRYAQSTVSGEMIHEAESAWHGVLNEHGDYFDQSVLSEIANAIDDINTITNTPPHAVCHGDFHAGNLLQDGDDLVLCDWQNVSIGKGIGDLSFFISRGLSDGLPIDEGEMLKLYCDKLSRKVGKEFSIKELKLEKCAMVVKVSFLHWANYLHGSDRDRVQGVYTEMVEAFRYITGNGKSSY